MRKNSSAIRRLADRHGGLTLLLVAGLSAFNDCIEFAFADAVSNRAADIGAVIVLEIEQRPRVPLGLQLCDLAITMSVGERARLNSPISAHQRVEKVLKARASGKEAYEGNVDIFDFSFRCQCPHDLCGYVPLTGTK